MVLAYRGDKMTKATQTESACKLQKADESRASFPRILWRYLTQKVADKMPQEGLPVKKPDLSGSHDILIKISHSTVLMRLDGQYLLTDPVFSHRASPVQFAGPKRFHDLPLSIADLPRLDIVAISHDHYDHLDKGTIKALAAKANMFVVPPGVDHHLRRFGVAAKKITVIDWWQQTTLGSITLHATPAQHFSGRGLFDKNATTWASFVIESTRQRIFFSGDSGYFSGFAEIGKRFGGFDLALVETGAYDDMWPDVHMQPEQSLRAHLDLQARYMLPIHNSSFDLAMHAWYEPLQRVAIAAEAYQASLITPQFGAVLDLTRLVQAPQEHGAWWRALMPNDVLQNSDAIVLAK
jgi:L-ascorbate metabolism protein UlaG (beta-lactamase superfamily)